MWKTGVEGKKGPGPGPSAKGTDLAAVLRSSEVAAPLHPPAGGSHLGL